MTCNWLLSSVIFDLFAMNSFTKCISAMPPASKPRESWKINPGLLWNTSSFSMLCDPCWEDVSSTEIIKGGFIPAHWATPLMCRFDHQQCINVYGRSCAEWRRTLFPLLSNISGCSDVLHTFWRIVVLPALARPMTRTRKQPASARISSVRGSDLGFKPRRLFEVGKYLVRMSDLTYRSTESTKPIFECCGPSLWFRTYKIVWGS
jgi:hypothetical protein